MRQSVSTNKSPLATGPFDNLEEKAMDKDKMTLELYGVKRYATVLKNGAKLVLFQKRNAPVFMRSTFVAGSRFDPIGKEGVSHFLEHMLVAGSKKFPTKDKLAAYIEQFGGEMGAFTSGETLNINVSVADPEDLETSFEIMHEMLLESVFDEKTFETERGAIQKELSGKKSTPDKMLWELYPLLFFEGSDMGRSILGTKTSIDLISLEDIKEFYRRYIVSNRMTFLISGDVQFEKVEEFANKYLDLKSGDSYEKAGMLAINQSKRTPIMVERYTGSEQVHFLFGFRIGTEDPTENVALDLISETLGGGRSSVLTRKLRYEKGLVYSLSSGNNKYSDVGVAGSRSSTTLDKLQEVIDIITDEYVRVREEGLSQEELDFVKNKKIKSLRMQLQTSLDWIDMYTNWERGVGGPFGVEAYVDTIQKMRSETTRDAAKKYFTAANWYLALCGDIDSKSVDVTM